MGKNGLLLALALAARAWAQSPCEDTPAYSTCEIVFELSDQDAAAHPNPYMTVDIHAEFRSPRFRTYKLPAYWDGGRRMVIRFAPTEAGAWTYRVTSNVKAWEGKTGSFHAAASEAPGFIRPANVHHWMYTEERRPHLWMGDSLARFDQPDRAAIDTRAAAKFNHLRGPVFGFSAADKPDLEFYKRVDETLKYINSKGVIADLILGDANNQLAQAMPDWQHRQRYVRYLVGRYSAMNITWAGVRDFESYANGRTLLKEIGTALKELDPYQHPRSTLARVTSAPLVDDGWMDFVTYGSSDDQLGAIEHQLYRMAFVNADESRGDTNTFRRKLWNTTMNGQYAGMATGGGENARTMAIWNEFLAGTRHWELEPYFDVDGGRGVALEGVEYIVYVEKPGPVEVLVEKHGYDVRWFNPINGEYVKMKDYKGEHFIGEPPDKGHDWVLIVSREGRKEGMLRSYKFESRPIAMQEIERNLQKMPFEIEQPSADHLAAGGPAPFSAKMTRETHATRSMMWLWTAEVPGSTQGYRVVGTGQKGTLEVPSDLAPTYPSVIDLRLYGMNAVGKVYSRDRAYQLTK